MQPNDDLNKKIIDALKSLPRVHLAAEEKEAQLGAVAAAISTGAVAMKEFPLARLILDRIKEELAKYLVFSILVVSILTLGTLGYLVYPQTISKPPLREKPALMQKSESKKQPKTRKASSAEETQAQDEQQPSETTESTGQTGTSTGETGSKETATGQQPSSSQAPASQQQPETAVIASNQAPTCNFKILSEPPLIQGNPVKFSATFSDPDGKIVKVKWDLGDGNFLEHGPDINLVQHIYSSPGTYNVTLTVFDDGGASAQVSKTVNITGENQAPTADFTHNAPKEVGEPITFTNQSYDPDGFIVETKWDFGDGKTSTDKNPTHSYEKAGSYTVTLEVTDDQGATSKTSKNIEILNKNQPPTCSFRSNAPKRVGLPVTFWPNFEDPDGKVTKLKWGFGNGTTLVEDNPDTSAIEYIYIQPGKYTVTLTVFDDRGASDSFSENITIFKFLY